MGRQAVTLKALKVDKRLQHIGVKPFSISKCMSDVKARQGLCRVQGNDPRVDSLICHVCFKIQG